MNGNDLRNNWLKIIIIIAFTIIILLSSIQTVIETNSRQIKKDLSESRDLMMDNDKDVKAEDNRQYENEISEIRKYIEENADEILIHRSRASERSFGTWTMKKAMLTPRCYHAIGVINNKIHVIGGWNYTNYPLNVNEEYDPTTNSWNVNAPMPTNRSVFAIGVVNNKIYAIGGTGYNVCNVTEEYDPVTDTWTLKAPMPTTRYAHAIGVVSNKIYVIGGRDNSGLKLDVTEEYDPSTDSWTSKAPMPTNRSVFAIGVVNNKIYAIGGTDSANLKINATEEYDPSTDSWTSKAPMPTARHSLAIGVADKKIYAIGGQGVGGAINMNEKYDPATDSWTIDAQMPTSRDGLAIGVVSNKIYAIGGYDYEDWKVNEEYDPNFVSGGTDSDGDSLTDDIEIEKGTYHDDADSDDDGIIDGFEMDWDKDPDDDGIINARDPDSDGDGVYDGTEIGLDDSNIHEDTDLTAGYFVIDADNTTIYDPTNWDTDGDGKSDGDEDINYNGKYEPEHGETDPLFADTDEDGIENSLDPDDDNDGMPDVWENRVSASTGNLYGDPFVNDANDDNDKDGISNYMEFLGDDGVDGPVDDSSDPWDPLSVPNTAPMVRFKLDKLVLEADEMMLFDENVVSVSDSEGGPLIYIWDFDGDGVNDTAGRTSLDILWAYDQGEWVTKLRVIDNKGQTSFDTIIVQVGPSIGENGTIYTVGPSDDTFIHTNKIVRKSGYIAYKFTKITGGDYIDIKFTVTQGTGIRIFVFNEFDYENYDFNRPELEGKKISKVYESGWKGINALVREEDYRWTIPDAPENNNIYVVIDNGYYQEYLKAGHEGDEAVTYTLQFERSSSISDPGSSDQDEPLLGQLSSSWGIAIIIIILSVIIIAGVAVFYGRKRQHFKPSVDDDKLIDNVKNEILYSDLGIDGDLSNAQIKMMLDRKYQNGQISRETYDYIINNVLIPEDPNLFKPPTLENPGGIRKF